MSDESKEDSDIPGILIIGEDMADIDFSFEGELPDCMSFDETTGVISGHPEEGDSGVVVSVTFTATNKNDITIKKIQ